MAFVPYQIQADRLPKLKAGHIFKIGEKFWKIKEVRRNRKSFTENLVTAQKPWNTTSGVIYTGLVGDLKNVRVVHLHYLSLTTAIACGLRWGTLPLLSRVTEETLDLNLANLAAPYEIDKWSYDETMHIKLTKIVGLQTCIVELIEYTVETGPESPVYLELTPQGEGVFHGY